MMRMIVWINLADNRRVCFTSHFYTRPDVSIYKTPLSAAFSPFSGLVVSHPAHGMWKLHALLFSNSVWVL